MRNMPHMVVSARNSAGTQAKLGEPKVSWKKRVLDSCRICSNSSLATNPRHSGLCLLRTTLLILSRPTLLLSRRRFHSRSPALSLSNCTTRILEARLHPWPRRRPSCRRLLPPTRTKLPLGLRHTTETYSAQTSSTKSKASPPIHLPTLHMPFRLHQRRCCIPKVV